MAGFRVKLSLDRKGVHVFSKLMSLVSEEGSLWVWVLPQVIVWLPLSSLLSLVSIAVSLM